jgi:hypothetical protein
MKINKKKEKYNFKEIEFDNVEIKNTIITTVKPAENNQSIFYDGISGIIPVHSKYKRRKPINH